MKIEESIAFLCLPFPLNDVAFLFLYPLYFSHLHFSLFSVILGEFCSSPLRFRPLIRNPSLHRGILGGKTPYCHLNKVTSKQMRTVSVSKTPRSVKQSGKIAVLQTFFQLEPPGGAVCLHSIFFKKNILPFLSITVLT